MFCKYNRISHNEEWLFLNIITTFRVDYQASRLLHDETRKVYILLLEQFSANFPVCCVVTRATLKPIEIQIMRNSDKSHAKYK